MDWNATFDSFVLTSPTSFLMFYSNNESASQFVTPAVVTSHFVTPTTTTSPETTTTGLKFF
jgi:hypothetical protein